MTAHFEVSQIIDRPIDTVFNFCAREHVRNHPRWDADITLWLEKDEPLKVGTIIRRQNTRSGTPVEGTMEVTEFDPPHAMATLIHDGQVVTLGRMTFETVGYDRTKITTTIEIPGMDDNMDKTFLYSRLESSGRIRKQLIESET